MHQNGMLTGNDILLDTIWIGLAPLAQCVARDVVGLKFTVGVGQHASDVGDDLRGAPIIRPQKHSAWVVVIGVDVVPDDRCSSQHRRDIFQSLDTDFLANHFASCNN